MGVCVEVGEGIKVVVAVLSLAVAVPVGSGIGDEVAVSALDVSVGDGKGNEVRVDGFDCDVAVGDGIGGKRVSVTGLVSVIEITVLVGVDVVGGEFTGNHRSKQMNNNKSRIATTSLNRS